MLCFIMEKVCMSLVGGRSGRSIGVYALDQWEVTDRCVCLKKVVMEGCVCHQ